MCEGKVRRGLGPRRSSPLARKKKKPAGLAASPDVSDGAMRVAAQHLVKSGRRWELHPDGCVQADVQALDGGLDVVFWRGRGAVGVNVAVLAVVPRASVSLAEVLDRPLAPWSIVPAGHAVLSFQHGTHDVRLVAPSDLLATLRKHVYNALSVCLL